MQEKILSALAVLCQFLTLYPAVVVTEGAAFGEFVGWHYFAMYAVIALFYISGRVLGQWSSKAGLSRKARPWAMFLARTGFILPGVLFCVIGGLSGLHAGVFLYLLPGCVAGYFGGYLSAGKSYSDIFTRGWFAVYFVLAIVAAVLLNFTHDSAVINSGMTQLSASFVILIAGAAVLTNQTNIDMQTRQRAGGKAVLPAGVRSYNAKLIAGAAGLIAALCLFARPIAGGIFSLLKMLIQWLISLLNRNSADDPQDGAMDENTAEDFDFPVNENPLFQLLIYVLVGVLIFLAVKFRRQIWAFIKEIFQPLFRLPVQETEQPFIDEFSDSTERGVSVREQRRTERELVRRYRRESDPALKFRAGYELFLIRLGGSAFPQLPTDTTTVHSDKGERSFGERLQSGEISAMVRTYERVRYGGGTPDSAELAELDRLLTEIKAI